MAQVCAHRHRFERRRVRILVVSFADRSDWAESWRREVCRHFPLLLDPERKLYGALGVNRSLSRAWNVRTLLYYARSVLTGHALHAIQGDSFQLGGDFLFDQVGRLVHAHRSRDPVDRPTVEELIAEVDRSIVHP